MYTTYFTGILEQTKKNIDTLSIKSVLLNSIATQNKTCKLLFLYI